MTSLTPWFDAGVTLECDPLVVEDRLYIAGLDASVRSLHPATGKERWSVKLRGTQVNGLAYGDGIVYAAVSFTGTVGPGTICAVDAATGDARWVHKAAQHVGTGPAVAGGVLYYGMSHGSISARAGELTALDLSAGRARWTFDAGPFAGTPVVFGDDVLAASQDGALYCVRCADGSLRWRFETAKFIAGTPAATQDLVLIGSFDHVLYALESGTGQERWRFESRGPFRASPVVANATVYVGSYDEALYAIELNTGKLRWRYRAGSAVLSTATCGRQMVYVGCSDASVHAVDRDSGVARWVWEGVDPTRGGVIARPLLVRDRLLIANRNGCVYALDPLHGAPRPAPPNAEAVTPASGRSAPRVTPRAVGSLSLPSGELVVCDPVSDLHERPITVTLRAGTYRLAIGFARWDDGDERIAYLLLRVADGPLLRWESARAGAGKRPRRATALVDSGNAALLSAEAAHVLITDARAEERFGEAMVAQMESRYRPTRSWANVAVAVPRQPDVLVCSAGLGDGEYRCWWGLGARRRPICFVIDFAVVEDTLAVIWEGIDGRRRVRRER